MSAFPNETLAVPLIGATIKEIELLASHRGFAGLQVARPVDVSQQSGELGEIPLASLLATEDTARKGNSAGYPRLSVRFGKLTYACEEHGGEVEVPDRTSRIYRDWLDLMEVSTEKAIDVVLRNHEYRVASAIFNASTWTGAALTTDVGTEWSTIATATPITDVNNAREKIRGATGLSPNALVVSEKVWNVLKDCEQIVDRVKYGGSNANPAVLSREAVAAALGLDFVIVGNAYRNTGNEVDASATLSPIWDDEYAMVCRVATSNDPGEACIARTFHFSEDGSEIGTTVETYREEHRRQDVVRARHDVDEVVINKNLGHLLANVHA